VEIDDVGEEGNDLVSPTDDQEQQGTSNAASAGLLVDIGNLNAAFVHAGSSPGVAQRIPKDVLVRVMHVLRYAVEQGRHVLLEEGELEDTETASAVPAEANSGDVPSAVAGSTVTQVLPA